jgi:hypothetical protein
MMEDIDQQMDKVSSRLKVSNKRLKQLVAETGGTARYCYLLTTLIILLALVGYIVNLVVRG